MLSVWTERARNVSPSYKYAALDKFNLFAPDNVLLWQEDFN